MRIETLTAGDTSTRLHYDHELAAVWLDTHRGVRDGLVIGIGDTRKAALADAILELLSRVRDLQVAREEEVANEQEAGRHSCAARPAQVSSAEEAHDPSRTSGARCQESAKRVS